MSLLDKESLNYFTVVEQYFLRLKDSGLFLSANDYHLISEWENRGVPAPTLCRAIENGVEQARSNQRDPYRRLSLAYLKPIIEDEIQRAER